MNKRTIKLCKLRDKYNLSAEQLAKLLPDTSVNTVQGWLSSTGNKGGKTAPRTINKYALALLEFRLKNRKPRH